MKHILGSGCCVGVTLSA